MASHHFVPLSDGVGHPSLPPPPRRQQYQDGSARSQMTPHPYLSSIPPPALPPHSSNMYDPSLWSAPSGSSSGPYQATMESRPMIYDQVTQAEMDFRHFQSLSQAAQRYDAAGGSNHHAGRRANGSRTSQEPSASYQGFDSRHPSFSEQEPYPTNSLPPGPTLPPAPSLSFPDPSAELTNSYYLAHHDIFKNGVPPPTKKKDKKKPRQQFSACGACRRRRVKCDLKDKQEEWDLVYGVGAGGEDPGMEKLASVVLAPTTLIAGIARREDLMCTNCKERKAVCVDEYAEIKAAKQVRRNKRPGERGHMNDADDSRHQTESYEPPLAEPRSGPHRSEPQTQYAGQGRTESSTRPYDHRTHSHQSAGNGNRESTAAYDPGFLMEAPGPSTADGSDRRQSYIVPQDQVTYAADGYARPYEYGKPVPPISFPSAASNLYDAITGEKIVHYTSSEMSVMAPPPPPSTYSMPAPSEAAWTSTDISSMVPQSVRTIETSRNTPPKAMVPQAPIILAPVVSLSSEPQDLTLQPAGGDWIVIPELSAAFFNSAFFRRFHIQRPIIDPVDFTKRYLSHSPPEAKHMGLTGAILCHVFYAWACSYGVDEHGELDIPERHWPGGTLPADDRYVWSAEQEREMQRLARKKRTDAVVRQVMREIDDAGVMRRHSWDGVRCMLLILPLTEFTSTPTERLAVYECAIAQVFALCSLSALNYEGQPLNLGSEGDIIRIRLYWYTFVHEGITTGLKGGRLVLEEEDLESFQGTLPNGWALVNRTNAHRTFVRLATAPIRLSLACRAIHKALTGSKARRRDRVHRQDMEDAWEALEQCWEEFESIREDTPPPYLRVEDVIRFSDGWKIFMFEAHNVIRESLEHRVSHLMPKPEGAFLRDLSISNDPQDARQSIQQEIVKLHQIAKAKCEHLTRQIIDIVRAHVNTTFFEWDASLVRDGTFYAAMSLAKEGGNQADVAVCLQAINEMRWAYSKTGDRSKKLRDVWMRRRAPDTPRTASGKSASYGGSSAPSISPEFKLPSTESLLQFQSISGLGANVGGFFPDMMGDAGSVNPSSEADVLGNMDGYQHEEDIGPDSGGLDQHGGYNTGKTLPPFDAGGLVGPSSNGYFPTPTNGFVNADPTRALQPLGYGEAQHINLEPRMSGDRTNGIAAWQSTVPIADGASMRRAGWFHEGAEPRGSMS